jgi:hypothetical protein
MKGGYNMGYWIFGIIVGILICAILPSDVMTRMHDNLIKIITLGKAKINDKLNKS